MGEENKYKRERRMPGSTAPNVDQRLGEYISLAEAKVLAGYTQSSMVLNVAASSGKMKGIKKAGRWYTTVGWLNDYLLTVRRGNYKRGVHIGARDQKK